MPAKKSTVATVPLLGLYSSALACHLNIYSNTAYKKKAAAEAAAIQAASAEKKAAARPPPRLCRREEKILQGKLIKSSHRPRSKKVESIKETQFSAFGRSNQ